MTDSSRPDATGSGAPATSESAPATPSSDDSAGRPATLTPAPAPKVIDADYVVSKPDRDPDYTLGGVPTFDGVREKIEQRIARSIGTEELDAESARGKSFQQQWEDREKAAKDRLEQIRKSMGLGDSSS